MAKKAPDKPEDIFPELITDLSNALGTDLHGVCLFGSAARGAYVKGRSDINLLVVVADEAKATASRLGGFYRKWAPAGLAAPLVMTKAYIDSSLDVFPLELMTMAAAHKCIHGEDPLAGLAIDDRRLRLQLEREVKAKLMALQGRLIVRGGDEKELRRGVIEAAPAMTAILQGCLKLFTGAYPLDRQETLERAETAGLPVESFRRMAAVRAGKLSPKAKELAELLEWAVEQLDQLGRRLDQM